jgi:hypothetical protein
MDKLLMIFIGLSIVNVVFSTIKSIVTIKGSPFVASMVSALYYGYYNIVLIYTVADFPLWQKVVATFGCNLVGVYVVKYAEAKSRKDKLWKVEATVNTIEEAQEIISLLKEKKIPCNYVDINRYVLINCYCATQKQSAGVKNILDLYNAKYFATESKNL